MVVLEYIMFKKALGIFLKSISHQLPWNSIFLLNKKLGKMDRFPPPQEPTYIHGFYLRGSSISHWIAIQDTQNLAMPWGDRRADRNDGVANGFWNHPARFIVVLHGICWYRLDLHPTKTKPQKHVPGTLRNGMKHTQYMDIYWIYPPPRMQSSRSWWHERCLGSGIPT